MLNRWQSHRIAADYEGEAPEYEPEAAVAAADTETLTVAGLPIGASYGGQDEGAETAWLLGDAYHKQFASATPEARCGAYDGRIPGIDDREDARRLERERLGGTTIQGLMGHYVAKDARGRSSSWRKREAKRPKIESVVAKAAEDDADEQRHLGRHVVYGLTAGEAEFYGRRPGEARAVLAELVAQVLIARRVPDAMRTKQLGRPKPNFIVYGLTPYEVAVLVAFRGCTRAALVDYAHAHDHARIVRRDAPPIEVECEADIEPEPASASLMVLVVAA